MRESVLNETAWSFGHGSSEVTLDVFERNDEHIMEGLLTLQNGDWFPITRGVPCFIQGRLRPDFSDFERRHNVSSSSDQLPAPAEHLSTVGTFSDKWSRFKSYGMERQHQEFLFDWYCKKLGVADLSALKKFYQQKSCILEVGPGSGFNTRFMAEHVRGRIFAADISEAAYTTFGNTSDFSNCHVVQADLMHLPFQDDTFDFIIADGVLHHTPDTRASVQALYRKLKPNGQLFFYVYNKMGAARQFCDRFINQAFSQLDAEDCYAACEGLTELGRELSQIGATVTLENGIPILGIPAGTHDVQRLLYYNFVKCFWNDAFDFETNNMVNFDWYHPAYAWQHEEDEIRGWLADLCVEDFVFNPANPNGHSVLLRKPVTAGVSAA